MHALHGPSLATVSLNGKFQVLLLYYEFARIDCNAVFIGTYDHDHLGPILAYFPSLFAASAVIGVIALFPNSPGLGLFPPPPVPLAPSLAYRLTMMHYERR